MSDPYAYSQAAGPKKKSSIPWPWIIGGCSAIVILGLGCVGFFGWMFMNAKGDFTPITESYLAANDLGNYSESFELIAPGWKDNTTLEEYSDFHDRVKETLGENISIGFTSINYQASPGSKTATVGFNAQFENGPATLTVVFSEHDDVWLIQRCNYDSDLFNQNLTCPHCSQENPIANQYCFQCGKAL